MRRLILLFTFLIPATSFACKCEKPNIEETIKNSKYVFIARITSTRVNGSGEKFLKGVVAEFKLVKSLKGNPKELKKLFSGFGGGDCGIQFNVGFQYIIYANNGSVGICSGSQIYPGEENDDGYSAQVSEFIKTGKNLNLENVFFMDPRDESCNK